MTPQFTRMTTTPGFELLNYLQEEQLAGLLDVAEARVLQKDDVLIEEGDPEPDVCIVTRGLLDVRVGTQETISVGKRGPGELLGEVSFLTSDGANATVVALETSEVFALPSAALRKQLAANTEFAASLYQILGRVVAQKLTELSRRAVPFSVAITHSPELDGRLRETVHEIKSGLAGIEDELSRGKGEPSEDVRARTREILDHAMEALLRLLGPDSEIPPALHKDVGLYFRQEFLPFVLLSQICEQSYTKPRGYAGDFQAIDMLYNNTPTGVGRLGPLLDEYFLDIAVSQAVRNRRGLLLDIFVELLDKATERLNITSLACGPAREVFDLFDRLDDPGRVQLNCLDLDFQALSLVSRTAEQRGITRNLRLMQENLILLATGRTKTDLPPQDLMYSIGLIDYFQDKLVVKLLDWIFDTLRPGGKVVLGNFDPCNPDRPFLDHILEWPLTYRTPDQMKQLFEASKFQDESVEIRYEARGINLFAICHRPA